MYGTLTIFDSNTNTEFTKDYNSKEDMIKMLKKLCFSKHLTCTKYATNTTYLDGQVKYWYMRQRQ